MSTSGLNLTKPTTLCTHYTYTTCLLYQLDHSNPSRLDASAWNTLHELGIAARCPTKHGCRGGNKQKQHISVMIGHRPTTHNVHTISSHLCDNLTATLSPTYQPSIRQSTLRTIKHVDSHNCTKLALTNAKSAININTSEMRDPMPHQLSCWALSTPVPFALKKTFSLTMSLMPTLIS